MYSIAMKDEDFFNFIEWSKHKGYYDNFDYTIKTDSVTETVWKDGPVINALERGAILLLDECLDENEEVLIGTVDDYKSVKLSELEYNKVYPVVSFNMETGELENDFGSIISDKEDEIYEVEFEDGRVIRLNKKHPFIIQDEEGNFYEKTLEDGLNVGDVVVSFTPNFSLLKIKSIKSIGKGRVRNLTVTNNHTFLTSSGIVTHNCDLGSTKIMALQSVMEGKGVFLKKIGRYVKPAPGFNVIATANTKGKGSEDGRFVGTNVMNSAFLDRFAITFEQEYPSNAVENRILNQVAKSINLQDADEFIKKLCDWSDVIRKTFFDGGIDEVISTRRLVHILKAYSIFENKEKAIRYSISGFDNETKTAFIELYDKIDAEFDMNSKKEGEAVEFELVDA
jgi:hypothetical protein